MYKNNMCQFGECEPHHKHKQEPQDIEDMHTFRNQKTEANIFLKKSKICSTVNRPSNLLIKQPKEQELA